MRYSVLLFIFIFNLGAQECVTISGHKKDSNNAFKNATILKENIKVGKFTCHVFDSWPQADEYIQKSKLKKGDELLIFQGAHGIRGGGAVCNSADISGEQINTYLRKYSKKFKTAAIIDSCYSGDLIKSKLSIDFIEKDYKSMQNLCLVTSSSFNKLAYEDSNESLLNFKKYQGGKSIQETFADKKDLLTSSAAWDTVGISKFLTTKNLIDANQVFENLGSFLSSNNDTCATRVFETDFVKMCANPYLSNELISAIIYYQEITVQNENAIKKFIDKANKTIKANQDSETEDEESKATKLEYYEKACLQDLVAWFEFYSSPSYTGGEDIEQFLKRVSSDTKKIEGSACSLFIKQNKKEAENMQSQNQSPYQSGFNQPIPYGMGMGGTHLPQQDVNEIIEIGFDMHYLLPIISQSINIAQARAEVESRLGKENINSTLTPNEVITILNSDSARECRNEEDAITILNEILGGFNYAQFEIESANPQHKGKRKFSSYDLLITFNQVSFKARKIHNKSDRLRRKACEDFTF